MGIWGDCAYVGHEERDVGRERTHELRQLDFVFFMTFILSCQGGFTWRHPGRFILEFAMQVSNSISHKAYHIKCLKTYM